LNFGSSRFNKYIFSIEKRRRYLWKLRNSKTKAIYNLAQGYYTIYSWTWFRKS